MTATLETGTSSRRKVATLSFSHHLAAPADTKGLSAWSGYEYVDTAIGGSQNRNKVMKLSDFSPPVDAVDCFTTWLRYDKGMLDYAWENPSPKTGKPPSVSAYPGTALADFVPYDFDCKGNPGKALAEAAGYVRIWEKEWGLPPETLRIYFSGMKGVSIEAPADLFGGFEPAEDIAARLKRLAIKMTPDATTLDTSIYEKMRLWRVPNTKHGESGLYKVRLTAQELLDGTL